MLSAADLAKRADPLSKEQMELMNAYCQRHTRHARKPCCSGARRPELRPTADTICHLTSLSACLSVSPSLPGRASNYLTVGQIYLRENPLLRAPLDIAHIKPRLLGHWGTSPGLNMLWVHANRVLQAVPERDFIFMVGPGHGGPAIVAQVYLEGVWEETYPKSEVRDRNTNNIGTKRPLNNQSIDR